MFNEAGPLRGNSSLQSFGVSPAVPEQGPAAAVNKCSVCNKTFERLYNLKVHLRKHTGETPYDCPIKGCMKQFKWRSSMAHHVRAHHDISETMGVEVKCQARRSDQNPRLSNSTRNLAQSISVAGTGLSTGGVKKTVKKKLSNKSLGTGPSLQTTGFHNATHSVCAIPQWSIETSFPGENGASNYMQNIQPVLHDSKDPEYNSSLESPQGVIDCDEKFSGEEIKRGGDQLMEMVSEMFSKGADMLHDCTEPVPQIPPETVSEPLDTGLLFLADCSEDVTDAEMESLANFGGNLTASNSKETQSSSDITIIL